MSLTSDLVVAITIVISAVIALAALGLGIFNYRQARRRDTFQLRAAAKTMNSRLQNGTLEASDLEVELTNVGQRPVTVTDVALVWRRRGLRGRLARRGWRLRRRRFYLLHQRLQYGGLLVVENHPQTVQWGWAGAIDGLQRASAGDDPVLVRVIVAIGATERRLLPTQNHEPVETTVHAVLSGQLPVRRPAEKR